MPCSHLCGRGNPCALPSASARPTRLEQPQCNYTISRHALTTGGCDQHLTSCRCADARRAILQLQGCSASLARNSPSSPDLAYRGLLFKPVSTVLKDAGEAQFICSQPPSVCGGCILYASLRISRRISASDSFIRGIQPAGSPTSSQNRIR